MASAFHLHIHLPMSHYDIPTVITIPAHVFKGLHDKDQVQDRDGIKLPVEDNTLSHNFVISHSHGAEDVQVEERSSTVTHKSKGRDINVNDATCPHKISMILRRTSHPTSDDGIASSLNESRADCMTIDKAGDFGTLDVLESIADDYQVSSSNVTGQPLDRPSSHDNDGDSERIEHDENRHPNIPAPLRPVPQHDAVITAGPPFESTPFHPHIFRPGHRLRSLRPRGPNRSPLSCLTTSGDASLSSGIVIASTALTAASLVPARVTKRSYHSEADNMQNSSKKRRSSRIANMDQARCSPGSISDIGMPNRAPPRNGLSLLALDIDTSSRARCRPSPELGESTTILPARSPGVSPTSPAFSPMDLASRSPLEQNEYVDDYEGESEAGDYDSSTTSSKYTDEDEQEVTPTSPHY